MIRLETMKAPSLMKKIRILVIEDNRVLREGLIAMIDGQPDMHVVATIGRGNDVLLKTSL